MAEGSKYYIVDAGVLPEVYLRVAEAKRYLETGEEDTVNAAALFKLVLRPTLFLQKFLYPDPDRFRQSHFLHRRFIIEHA